MTQYKAEIIRTEDFVVKSTTKDTKGYLVVTGEDGKDRKVSPKRERLFPIFQPGVSVHLCYSTFNNQEYIADAVQSEQVIKSAISQPQPKETVVNPTVIAVKTTAIQDSKNRAFALSYAKDLAVAGKVEVGAIISWATVFDKYLSGDFVESESDILTRFIAQYGKKKGG